MMSGRHKIFITGILSALGLMLIGLLSFSHLTLLLRVGIFTCLVGYALIILCFTPLGALSLGPCAARLSYGQWLFKLLQGQAVLFIFTLAACIAFMRIGPSFVQGFSLSLGLEVIEEYSRTQWGIFPWGIFGFWGLIIAYVAYVKKSTPYFYQFCLGFFPASLENKMKSYVEAICFAATLLALNLVATSIALLLTYSLEHLLQIQHFEIPIIGVWFLSTISALLLLKRRKKDLRRLAIKNIGLNHLYAFCILLIVLIIILAAYCNSWIMEHFFERYQQLQCPQCGQHFISNTLMRFAIMYWGWWMIWTPLAGSYIAKISQGRTIRELVLGIYLVPLLLAVALNLWGTKPFSVLLEKAQGLSSPILFFSLGAVTWIIFSKMLKGRKDNSIFNAGFMPKGDSKSAGISTFAQKVFQGMFIIVIIHTMIGWYGLQLLIAAIGVLTIILIYWGFDFGILRFLKHKLFNKRLIS